MYNLGVYWKVKKGALLHRYRQPEGGFTVVSPMPHGYLTERAFPSLMFLCLCALYSAATGYGQADQASALIERLKSPEVKIRSEAATTLGSLKDPRAVEPLIAALKDEDVTV